MFCFSWIEFPTFFRSATSNFNTAAKIIRWVSFALGLPGVCLSIYLMSKQVSNGKAAPVYVISLLASDIFNIFGQPNKPIENIMQASTLADVSSIVFYFGVITNIVFMVCVAQERYLLVACSQHSACCMKVKQSAIVSLGLWAAPIAILTLAVNGYMLLFSLVLLMPFGILLFFLVDTFRALWCCKSSLLFPERKRILGMQVVLFFNYSILYLPFVLNTLFNALSLTCYTRYLGLVVNALLNLGPFVDPFISIFLTKVKDIKEIFSCKKKCCNEEEEEDTPSVVTVSELITRL
ncbi:hypothetical protein AMEX_G9628 [Astyanax mexicanus]|uniref:G-protein coupled receptors family 1 profile domain-containing protein n=1 Tax=Astyanax mexicanus TaxID=7994 RepID=A0A8T2LWH7_ASTMX|nr:hypothetical protein AMEX_G9628 [Astyanax mexicanus]